MASESPRYAQENRLKYLDNLFFWEGRANRSDLMNRFQISPAQAALDLRSYLEVADQNAITYDTRAKRYEATTKFKPVFGLPSPHDWTIHAAERCPEQVDVLPTLGRHTDVVMLARIYRAIRDNLSLQITYQSMTDDAPKERWIAPHALASDGLRWHARAYCFLHCDHRDFVLTRMSSLPAKRNVSASRPTGELPRDEAWINFVELDLVPAATLGISQAAAVRREYGFTKDILTIRVRKALVFYAIRRWGLDRPDSRLSIFSQREVKQGE